MTAHPQWPHTLKDAIAAEIIRWDGNSIGVAYTYRNEDHQMHRGRIWPSSESWRRRATPGSTNCARS
jgi:hypothetical protein